jgi:hypothetical protein
VHFDSRPEPGRPDGPSLGFKRVKALIASVVWRPELLIGLRLRDPIRPAWAYLQQEIDDHLHHAASQIASAMTWDAKRTRPRLALTAPTLLSAVWLQLADAVSNDRAFNRCRECGRWFEVGADVTRSDRRFCSDGCRSKAYRQRQDRARQLSTSGKSFEQIAAELDSDVETVRRWITGLKG